MMRILPLWLLACLFPVLATAAASPPTDTTDRDPLFAQARTTLAEKKAPETLTLVSRLLAQGEDAPELRLLAGNAHLTLSQLPEAALAYRRALLLDPEFSEASQNLDYVLETLGTPAPPAPTFWQKLVTFGPRSWWVLLTVTSFWLALTLFLMAWFRRATGRRTVRWIIPGSVCLFLALLGAGDLIARHLLADRDGFAAQVMKTAPLHTSPARSASPVVNALVPGTEVRVLDEVGDWRYIEVPTGESGPLLRGWSRAGDVLPVAPET